MNADYADAELPHSNNTSCEPTLKVLAHTPSNQSKKAQQQSDRFAQEEIRHDDHEACGGELVRQLPGSVTVAVTCTILTVSISVVKKTNN